MEQSPLGESAVPEHNKCIALLGNQELIFMFRKYSPKSETNPFYAFTLHSKLNVILHSHLCLGIQNDSDKNFVHISSSSNAVVQPIKPRFLSLISSLIIFVEGYKLGISLCDLSHLLILPPF